MAEEIKTFGDLKEAVVRRAKIASSVSAASSEDIEFIEECLNSRNQEINAERKWRHRRVERDILVSKKYSTGTVVVTNGSREVTVDASTVFSDEMLGRKFRISGDDEIYRIINVNSTANTIMLSERYVGTTNSSASFEIYQDVFGLFPDLDKIEEVSVDGEYTDVMPVGPEKMRRIKICNDDEEGKIEAFTIDGFTGFNNVTMGQFLMGHDFMGGIDYDVKAMETYPPIPDEDYTIHIKYSVNVTPMSSDSDEPLIPIHNRIILVYGALADWWGSQGKESLYDRFTAKFEKELREMEGDSDFTDDRPRFRLLNKWRRRPFRFSGRSTFRVDKEIS